MNAVSRFDAPRLKRVRGLPVYVQSALYVLGGFVALLLVFQLFFRYQYVDANGVTWRIDRLTQQSCQLDLGVARCEPAGSPHIKASSSTSTSTSTSTSVSLKSATPKHKH